MNKTLMVILVALCFSSKGFSQQLPLNTCGIVNVYDAAGNRTKRTYFCNNGSDPYPAKIRAADAPLMELQPVDALFPNPTTGRFSITFSKPLQDAAITLLDEQGRVFTSLKASGNKVELNLSNVAAGVYYVRIQDGQNVIVKKVVKHHGEE